MNYSDIWDWNFMWSVSRNFLATIAPFVMIYIGARVVIWLIAAVVAASRGKQ